MKIKHLLILILITLSSCNKKTDDSKLTCNEGCSVLEGKFITRNNDGVGNIPIELHSESQDPLGLFKSSRKIAVGTTGADGRYSLKFRLTDEEIKSTTTKYIFLSFKFDKTKFISVQDYEIGGNKELIRGFIKRDTTITANVYFNTPSSIKIKLNNFQPINPKDRFEVVAGCLSGLEKNSYTINGSILATGPVTEKVIIACGDEKTRLFINKMKNGIYTESDTTIYTPVGVVPFIEFNY